MAQESAEKALNSTALAVDAATLNGAQQARNQAVMALEKAISGLSQVVENDQLCRTEMDRLRVEAEDAARIAAETKRKEEEDAKQAREAERQRKDEARREKLRKAREAATSNTMQSTARPASSERKPVSRLRERARRNRTAEDGTSRPNRRMRPPARVVHHAQQSQDDPASRSTTRTR